MFYGHWLIKCPTEKVLSLSYGIVSSDQYYILPISVTELGLPGDKSDRSLLAFRRVELSRSVTHGVVVYVVHKRRLLPMHEYAR